jgi:tetratricopeptide (TPR) repeat protein
VLEQANAEAARTVADIRKAIEAGDLARAEADLAVARERYAGTDADLDAVAVALETARRQRLSQWSAEEVEEAAKRAKRLADTGQNAKALALYRLVMDYYRKTGEENLAVQTAYHGLLARDQEGRRLYRGAVALDRMGRSESARDLLSSLPPGTTWDQLGMMRRQTITERRLQAKQLFEQALDAARSERTDAYRALLQQVVSDYPDTDFADRARQRLRDMD